MKAAVNLAWMYSACAEGCLGGNIADWMTHPEEAGPRQEAV